MARYTKRSLAALPYARGIAVLSPAVPYSLEMYAPTRLPARTAGILMRIEPARGAVPGLALLGENRSALRRSSQTVTTILPTCSLDSRKRCA